jgi:hypothetical protein
MTHLECHRRSRAESLTLASGHRTQTVRVRVELLRISPSESILTSSISIPCHGNRVLTPLQSTGLVVGMESIVSRHPKMGTKATHSAISGARQKV